MSAGSSTGVLVFLSRSTQRRGYERVGPESAHLARARALQAYYSTQPDRDEYGLIGRDATKQDEAVVVDLRDQVIQDCHGYPVQPELNTRTVQAQGAGGRLPSVELVFSAVQHHSCVSDCEIFIVLRRLSGATKRAIISIARGHPPCERRDANIGRWGIRR